MHDSCFFEDARRILEWAMQAVALTTAKLAKQATLGHLKEIHVWSFILHVIQSIFLVNHNINKTDEALNGVNVYTCNLDIMLSKYYIGRSLTWRL